MIELHPSERAATASAETASRPAAQAQSDITRVQLSVIQLARQLKASDTSDLPTSARTAIAALVKYGPVPAGRLADIEGVDPASISRTLRLLDDKGLIVRTADPTDGRVSVISVSDQGAEYFYTARQLTTEFIIERLSALDASELHRVAAIAPVLEQLVELTA